MTIIPISTADVDTHIVEMCERLLGWAKEGEIQGIAYVTVKPGRFVGTAYHITANSKCSHELVSGASMLQHRILARQAEDLE